MSLSIRNNKNFYGQVANPPQFWRLDNSGNLYNTNTGDISGMNQISAINLQSENSISIGSLQILTDNSANSYITTSNPLQISTSSLNILSFVGIGTNPSTFLDISGNKIRIQQPLTPSPTDGNIGDICWDDNKIYVKTTTGWKSTNLIP